MGLAYVGHHLDGVAAGEVRQLATDLRDRFGDRAAVVALVGGTAEKPAVVVATNQPARDRGLSAGDLVREASTVLGGKGGGRPDIAQGGGSDASKVPAALQAVEHAVGHVLQNA